jgi:hypothetical protein
MKQPKNRAFVMREKVIAYNKLQENNMEDLTLQGTTIEIENDKKNEVLEKPKVSKISTTYDNSANQWWDKRRTAEVERIENWMEKGAKSNPSFSYKQDASEANKVKIDIDEFDDTKLSDNEKGIIRKATLCAVSGSANENFARLMFSQATSASFVEGYDHATIANAFNGALLSMAPQDEIEGMLCSRMLALNNQSMHFLARAAHPEMPPKGLELNINIAVKLMRVQNETLEALNKYRRKGEQRVVVQHVNVNSEKTVITTGQLGGGAGDNGKN